MGFANCVEYDPLAVAALLHDPLPSGAQKMKRLLMILLLGVLGCGPDTTKSVAELEKSVALLEKLGASSGRNGQGEIVHLSLRGTQVSDAVAGAGSGDGDES